MHGRKRPSRTSVGTAFRSDEPLAPICYYKRRLLCDCKRVARPGNSGWWVNERSESCTLLKWSGLVVARRPTRNMKFAHIRSQSWCSKMPFTEVLYDVSEQIATVTLNRPDRLNAWTSTMGHEVLDAMQQAERDENVRVIVLTGAGRGFCAGADLDDLAWIKDLDFSTGDVDELKARMFPDPGRTDARPDFATMHTYFPSIDKPIIAAINGPSVGLGMVFPLYCDVRIGSDRAKFSSAFSRRGLIAEYGMAWMLPKLIGLPNAMDLLVSARLIDAEEALAMGLLNRIVPHDSLMDTVREYAKDLATNVSPRSMAVIKRQMYSGLFQTLRESVDLASEEMVASMGSADFREGVAHFLEKRPPKFTGE